MKKFILNRSEILLFSKKLKLRLLLVLFFVMGASTYAQVTTNSGSGLASTYPNLAAAITALNNAVITSPVTITLTGNATAPVGGFEIRAQGTAANPIVIQGASSTITAFSPQTQGVLTDAIFKLIGADFVTIQNFTMQENTSNTVFSFGAINTMTEFGVALLCSSSINGSQNNIIQNNIISLNRSYLNTFGIYSNTSHSATNVGNPFQITASTGANSFNKIYSNSISSINFGIVFIGEVNTSELMDFGNQIGGFALGNTITNWGGANTNSFFNTMDGLSYCIHSKNQINDTISYNTIVSAALAQATASIGIGKSYNSVPAPSLTMVSNITNNIITITNTGTGAISGISNAGISNLLPAATFNINNNTIQNCVLGGSTSTTNGITGIFNIAAVGVLNMNNNVMIDNAITSTSSTTGYLSGINNQSAAGTLNMNNNVFRNFSSSSNSGSIAGISNGGNIVTALNINNNQFGNAAGGFFTSTVATSGNLFAISCGGSLVANAILTIDGNDIRGIVHNVLSTLNHSYIGISNIPVAAGARTNIQNNTFTNLNVNTTGSITLIRQFYSASSTGIKNVINNSIVTAFAKSATAASGAVVCVQDGGSSLSGSVSNCLNNNFSNITVAGTSVVVGIGISDGASTKIANGNIFNNINTASGTITPIAFSSFGGDSSLTNNTITNVTGTGAIIGISLESSGNFASSVLVAGNTINNLTSSGGVIGISCGNTSTGIRIFSNTINTLTSSISEIKGIDITAANASTGISVSQNTIFNLSNTRVSNTAFITGIAIAGTGVGNIIQRNSVYDLNIATTESFARAIGIVGNGGTSIFRNNSVRFGSGITNATRVVGILEASGNNSFFHNSVFINGNPIAGTESSYAFSSTVTTNTRSISNNIFFNARSNSGATGKNYVVNVGGTGSNPAGLTMNNNVYFANGTGAVFGLYAAADVSNLTAWRTAVGQDAASISNNPLFTSVSDLSLQATSPALNVAANLGVSNDFLGSTRPGANTTFDIGAFERDGVPTLTRDIAATAFLNPVNNGIRFQNASFVPQATFSNLGTLNQNTVTVRYRIVNSSATEVYNQTVVVPAMINSLTNTVTFPAAILTATGTYTIFAIAELAGDLLTSNNQASGTLNVQGPLSGTITVGTGGNYTSLTNASGFFDEINQRGVNGNIVVNIITDLTTESGTIALNEFAAPWTVLIKPSATPRVLSGNTTTALIGINGADRVTIDGSFNGTSSKDLTIANMNNISPTAIAINSLGLGTGATNNTIRNCNITTATVTSGSTYGIAIGGTIIGAAGADNDNTTIQNNAISAATVGIYAIGTELTNAGGLNNLIISNNSIITNNNSERTIGIKLGNALNCIVFGNTINVQSFSGNPVGISLEIGFTSSTVANNVITRVLNASFGGAKGITIGTGSTSSNLNVFNNVVYGVNGLANFPSIDNSSLGIAIGFIGNSTISTTTSGNINLFNNTVNMAGNYTSTSRCLTTGLFVGGFASALDIRNNIFVNSLNNTETVGQGQTSKNYSIYSLAANSAFTNLNNNDYFVSGAQGVLGFIDNDRTNLVEMVVGFGQNAASINENPVFTSATNLLPTVCAVDNKGKVLNGITLDANGATRGTSTPDIGAFEINGVALGCAASIENIWSGSAWSLGTPIASQKLVFAGPYAENVDLAGSSVEVRLGAATTLPSGFDMNVLGPIVIASGTLTIANNANLVQSGLIENTGNITVNRNTAMQRLAYTYWSAPVAGQNLLAFSPLTLSNRFYAYNENPGAFVAVVPSTTNFITGTGYAIRAPNTFADAPAAATAFVGSFIGQPNNGAISVAAPQSGPTLGDNLVGNPYPCTLSATAFLSANSNIQALYFWTKSNLAAATGTNYASLTRLGGTAASAGGATPTGIIQVGQGFFATASATTMVTFNNAMKIGNNDNQFFRNANSEEKHLIRLNLTSNNFNFNQILVGYMNGATVGVDTQIDGRTFGNGDNMPTMISSIINGDNYAIQGKGMPFVSTDVIQLGFKAEIAGNYTISTADMEGIFAGNQDFYIKDNLTNTTHNIKQSPYNFVSAAGTFNSRFQLVYQTVLGVSNPSIENDLVAYVKNDLINIKSTINMTNIKVYDVSGRLVCEKSNINTNSIELNDLKTEHQMLLIQIKADGKTATKKIVY